MKGRSIVISGPDGAGKSAVADAVVAALGGPARVRRFHHRAPILPRRTQSLVPVTEPHAKSPYGRLLSAAKVAWLAVDMQLMWRVLVPLTTRRGIHVVVERGWWDLAVDPRRYRLASASLATVVGRSLPAPDLEVILGGDPAVMVARKHELPVEELERQLAMWRSLRPPGPRTMFLDASDTIEDLTTAITSRLVGVESRSSATRRVSGHGVHGLAHVPPWGRPRWELPRGPRALSVAGLRVYQPVTRRASLGWAIARVGATIGALRLMPGPAASPLAAVVAGALPRGTSFATSAARKPGRGTVLALDPAGRAVAVAKIATDVAGRRRLIEEGELGERLRVALPPPLAGPALIGQGDGYLLFEAVDWVGRPRAWELPEEVAWAMGRFHLAGRAAGSDRGFTHGDFAPWNLLRTATGWSLVDWADAAVDGLAFHDPLHYLVQSHALLGRPRRHEILAGLRGEGPVGAVLRAYAQGAELDLADVPDRMRAYLDRSEAALLPGADEARGRRARAELRMDLTSPGA